MKIRIIIPELEGEMRRQIAVDKLFSKDKILSDKGDGNFIDILKNGSVLLHKSND